MIIIIYYFVVIRIVSTDMYLACLSVFRLPHVIPQWIDQRIIVFIGADPLASSGSSAASAPVPGTLPPQFVPPGQEHPLVAMAQNYERMCAEMLSRPPYNTDAILAQQVTVDL